jgi:hypothetical protein
MFNKVMEEQGGYRYLDVAPRTIAAKHTGPLTAATAIISANPMLKKLKPLSKR